MTALIAILVTLGWAACGVLACRLIRNEWIRDFGKWTKDDSDKWLPFSAFGPIALVATFMFIAFKRSGVL